MSQFDSYTRLMIDIRKNQMLDDSDPNNTTLQVFTSPYDAANLTDSVIARKVTVSSFVWGTGATYNGTDSAGNTVQLPSCGWYWGTGMYS